MRGKTGDDTPAEVFNMPDGFGNLATKCVGHGFRASVAGRAGEDSAAEVHDFPDGFGNLATKCVGKGRRAYATTKSVRQEDEDDVIVIPADAVIVDDPRCQAP
ncbi:hypothetical protein ACFY30_04515 [Streptomyces sp. NPDC000345]|uniref:hypothetical protein n=1 Tax=Streptomyces sp. NPDC000345 TaxID=3364537 RepID=UPI0036863B05